MGTELTEQEQEKMDEKEERKESAERLEEIKDEISELLEEAADLLPRGIMRDRANAYWYAQIRMALDDDHEYLGSGSHTIQDSIDELNGEDENAD